MNRNLIILITVFIITVVGCGGSETNTPSNPIVITPSPATPITSVSLTGLRSDYSILKTSSGYSVTDKTGATQSYSQINQFIFSDMRINLGIGDKSQTMSPANLQSLIELYIAYFNRVPDADGLSYWIDQVKAGQTIDQIGQSFYNAAIQYSSLTGYSATMTNSDFVKIIYKNVLGRDTVDQEGLDYWTKSLASGAATRGTLINTILGSAHGFKGDKTYGWVADLLDNKVKLANLFTIQQGINYLTEEESITKTMALVAAIKPNNTANAVTLIGRVDWMFREVPNPTFKSAPIPVQSTSNLNAKNLNIPSQKMPTALPHTDTYSDHIGGGIAFGDFFQAGEISMVVFTNREVYFSADRSVTPGVAKFFRMINGDWVEQTKILDIDTGCISPRRVLVADFNNDGIPDVFASCHGSEAGPGNSWPGERPRILLSHADGTYKNIAAPITCYCHGATAGDIDADGNIDIVLSDFNRARDGKSGLVVLKGDGTGSFQMIEGSGFVAPTADYETYDKVYYKSYFDLELIDLNNDSKLDLFLGTGETTNSYIVAGNGRGQFQTVLKTFPKSTLEYHFNDAVFSNGFLYIYTNLNTDNYKSQIRKYDLKNESYTVIFDGATRKTSINPNLSPQKINLQSTVFSK